MHNDILFNRLNRSILRVFGDGNLGMDLTVLDTDSKTDIVASLNEIYSKEKNITKQIGDAIRAKFSAVTDEEIMGGTAANSLVDTINQFFIDVKREIMVQDGNVRTISSGSSSITILDSDANALPSQRATSDDQEGVIVQAGKNQCTIRSADTDDEILTADGHLVYGLIDRNGTDDGYVISLKYKDNSGTEQDYVVSADTNIKFAFPQRFNLFNLPASASRTAYFNRIADISEELNLLQIAKDLYTTPSLDGDGNANLGEPIQTTLSNLRVEVDNIEDSLGDAIDADGTFLGYNGTNYIDGSRSMSEADILLDNQLKGLSDRVDAIEVSDSEIFLHKFYNDPVNNKRVILDSNTGIVTEEYVYSDSNRNALLMKYERTIDSQGKTTQEVTKEYDGSGADESSATLLKTITTTYDYSVANEIQVNTVHA